MCVSVCEGEADGRACTPNIKPTRPAAAPHIWFNLSVAVDAAPRSGGVAWLTPKDMVG